MSPRDGGCSQFALLMLTTSDEFPLGEFDPWPALPRRGAGSGGGARVRRYHRTQSARPLRMAQIFCGCPNVGRALAPRYREVACSPGVLVRPVSHDGCIDPSPTVQRGRRRGLQRPIDFDFAYVRCGVPTLLLRRAGLPRAKISAGDGTRVNAPGTSAARWSSISTAHCVAADTLWGVFCRFWRTHWWLPLRLPLSAAPGAGALCTPAADCDIALHRRSVVGPGMQAVVASGGGGTPKVDPVRAGDGCRSGASLRACARHFPAISEVLASDGDCTI